LNDEQEAINHPSVASGCVANFYTTNYKNADDKFFYKITFKMKFAHLDEYQ
jgi:hypothetical protein